jgi:dTDP-4-amino-4,6-dideoxygalactose transaminase
MIETERIPLVDLTAQFRPIKRSVLEALESILDGMHLFLGENVAAFEREFADYCGAKAAIGVASGTDALYLALRAAGVERGDEVITVSNTFIATVEAILLTGATPVLVDVEPETLTIDPREIEPRITTRTRAIVPVHLYGRIADMEAIGAIARQHDLVVVEDACQAHGARRGGRAAGTFGAAGCFSFYYSKNLGAYGEAGAIVTDDKELAERIRRLRNHGSAERYLHAEFGVNSRLDELQAAVLRIKLPHLDSWNARRRAIAATYDRLLGEAAGVRPLAPGEGEDHTYHLYVVRTETRQRLRDELEARGIATAIHYPVPIHQQVAWSSAGLAPERLPITEVVAGEILSLPMYPELTDSDIAYICQHVSRIAGETSSNGVAPPAGDVRSR